MADRCKQCNKPCYYKLGPHGLCGNCRRELMPCKHCGERARCHPRGLCTPCYYTPEIRNKYPLDNSGGVGHSGRNGLPPPTTALPGTKRKKKVLAWRAKNKYLLWSPLDPNFFDDPEEVLA